MSKSEIAELIALLEQVEAMFPEIDQASHDLLERIRLAIGKHKSVG